MDYYNLLGLKRTAHAGEIRTAFRRLAKGAHPDAHPHLTGEEKMAMHRQFIELAHAYETLSDPIRRADYDREMRSSAQASSRATGAARAAGAAGAAGASTRRTPPRGPAAKRAPPRRHAPKGAPPRGGPQQSRPGGRSRQHPPPPPGHGTELDDLMAEVQGLLDKFGLDMRQQFGDTLDKALNWALTVFVEVLAALESGKEEPQKSPPRAAPSGAQASGAEPPREAPREGSSTSKKSSPATRPQPPPPNLDDELAALKKQVRSSGDRNRGRAPSRQSVEEALQKIKEKKKP